MQTLRHFTFLTRLVLAWFVLSLGVAVASWGVDRVNAALPLWVAPWGLLVVGFAFAAGLKTRAPAERPA